MIHKFKHNDKVSFALDDKTYNGAIVGIAATEYESRYVVECQSNCPYTCLSILESGLTLILDKQ